MKDTRQGNDIKISWSIFKKGGQIFSLEGKNISLYLKSVFGRKELNDFVVTGNIIQWTFYGKDQKNSGKYSLELVINEGEKGMITTDKCDFVNLVSCSCKLQGGEDAPNVETESIELTSTLEYVSGGGSYDDTALWRALDNKVDKVEGKELSSNDYTDEDKAKVDGLEEELAKKAEKSEIPTKMSQLEQDVEIGSDYDDTEIKQELTELSAEVSGLSEKIENLPSGESDVFKAEYGVTTYEEVSEAYNKGKIIHCDYESRCYELAVFTGDIAWFSCLNTTTSFLLMLNADSSWSKASYGLENAGNRVDTIQADAKPYQYPSAQAVYDFVNTTLGTIINGDY